MEAAFVLVVYLGRMPLELLAVCAFEAEVSDTLVQGPS